MRIIRFCVALLCFIVMTHACARAGEVSEPSGALRRQLRGRRLERHHRPRAVRLALGASRPAVHRGEPRRAASGNVGAASVVNSPPDGYTVMFVGPNNAISAVGIQEAAVRFPARHRAGRRHHDADQHHGGAALAAGEDRRGVHRLRQGQSRHDQHGLARRRHLAAHVGRTVQDDDRHRDAAHALSRRGPGLSRT